MYLIIKGFLEDPGIIFYGFEVNVQEPIQTLNTPLTIVAVINIFNGSGSDRYGGYNGYGGINDKILGNKIKVSCI